MRDVRIRGKVFLQWIEKEFVLRVLTRCIWLRIGSKFNIYVSVPRKCIPIYIQQDATLHSLFISGNCSTCFGWYFYLSSGANTTVSTSSGIFLHRYYYLPLSWKSWNALVQLVDELKNSFNSSTTLAGSNVGKYYQML
jgi:hypothetical protein